MLRVLSISKFGWSIAKGAGAIEQLGGVDASTFHSTKCPGV